MLWLFRSWTGRIYTQASFALRVTWVGLPDDLNRNRNPVFNWRDLNGFTLALRPKAMCSLSNGYSKVDTIAETKLNSQSSVEQSVVVGRSWKLLASNLVLRIKSIGGSSPDEARNLLIWGTDLLLCRRFLAISAIPIKWISTSFKGLKSVTGEDSPLLDDPVELDDNEVIFPELFRRLLLSSTWNFSSIASCSVSTPRPFRNVQWPEIKIIALAAHDLVLSSQPSSYYERCDWYTPWWPLLFDANYSYKENASSPTIAVST